MTKRTKILIIGLFIGCFFIANQISAAGLIPCGGHGEPTCNICHFFVLIETILEFVFFKLAPPLALLMLVIGGGMFMLATGDPQKITQAKKIITSVLIGIVVIYGSFFLVGLFLQSIGLNTDWTKPLYESWWEKGIFSIKCDIPSDTDSSAPPDTIIPPDTTITM